MLRSATDAGELDPRFEQRSQGARDMLRRIHRDMMIVCSEACALNDTRNKLCDEEEAKEMGGHYLTSKIEELKIYLASVLVNGCTSN